MEALLRSIERSPDSKGMSIEEIISSVKDGESVTVLFLAVCQAEKSEPQPLHISGNCVRKGHEYIVKVKRWMTQETTSPAFDFMAHWNQNVPMPFRVMRGRVLNETRGMVYMELRACPLKTDSCMRCGRPLTHPVSRLYGLGPECGGHAHINPFETEEELQAAIHEVRAQLNNITWKGWIAKSGIEYATEVLPEGVSNTRCRRNGEDNEY